MTDSLVGANAEHAQVCPKYVCVKPNTLKGFGSFCMLLMPPKCVRRTTGLTVPSSTSYCEQPFEHRNEKWDTLWPPGPQIMPKQT